VTVCSPSPIQRLSIFSASFFPTRVVRMEVRVCMDDSLRTMRTSGQCKVLRKNFSHSANRVSASFGVSQLRRLPASTAEEFELRKSLSSRRQRVSHADRRVLKLQPTISILRIAKGAFRNTLRLILRNENFGCGLGFATMVKGIGPKYSVESFSRFT